MPLKSVGTPGILASAAGGARNSFTGTRHSAGGIGLLAPAAGSAEGSLLHLKNGAVKTQTTAAAVCSSITWQFPRLRRPLSNTHSYDGFFFFRQKECSAENARSKWLTLTLRPTDRPIYENVKPGMLCSCRYTRYSSVSMYQVFIMYIYFMYTLYI